MVLKVIHLLYNSYNKTMFLDTTVFHGEILKCEFHFLNYKTFSVFPSFLEEIWVQGLLMVLVTGDSVYGCLM